MPGVWRCGRCGLECEDARLDVPCSAPSGAWGAGSAAWPLKLHFALQPSVYTKIDDLSKKKFARLLTFWKKNKMFSADKINAMEGICAGDSFNLESLSKDDLCDLRAMLESMEEDVSLEDLVAKNPDFVKVRMGGYHSGAIDDPVLTKFRFSRRAANV